MIFAHPVVYFSDLFENLKCTFVLASILGCECIAFHVTVMTYVMHISPFLISYSFHVLQEVSEPISHSIYVDRGKIPSR